MAIKAILQALANRLGYRIVPSERDCMSFLRAIGNLDTIRTVVDVGADTGTTVERWLKMFPKADIFAFEPARQGYVKVAHMADTNARLTAFNFAAGAADCEIEFEVHTQHESSSSALLSTKLSREMLPFTAEAERIPVQQRRLDTVFGALPQRLHDDIFIKMDVQGYECEVLKGAPALLARTKWVLTEVTLAGMYEGQASFSDIHALLTAAGLAFQGVIEQFHHRDGRPIYVDVVYGRDGLII
jgi:FkbM family methyltransferase